MIRLLVIDDHPVVSSGLAARYEALPGFQVVGVAASVRDALRLTAARSVDVAVTDIQLDATLTPRQVSALCERVRVVLFSARGHEILVQHLLAAGASTAVDKLAPLEQLDAALRSAHAGHVTPTSPTKPPTRPIEILSEREYAVYQALLRCQTPKEVAASLHIARSTVYCHIDNIRRKLNIQTLQELITQAYTTPK